MIYFANPSTQKIRDAVSEGHIGYIATPTTTHQKQRVAGAAWCADNGCFGKHFNIDRWWAWLQSRAVDAATCAFATAPDVVGEHAATLERSRPWLSKIRALGFPVAFVGQDGADVETVPWDDFDGREHPRRYRLLPCQPALVTVSANPQDDRNSLMRITCEFHYDSAHFLTMVPEGHKCSFLHGHTYILTVAVDGPVRGDGFVCDFADVKKAVDPLIKQLDHRLLNDIPGLENPTVEVQLPWLWGRIKLPGLTELTLREGLSNTATYRGEL